MVSNATKAMLQHAERVQFWVRLDGFQPLTSPGNTDFCVLRCKSEITT